MQRKCAAVSLFSCENCISKDAHIQSLVHQIGILERLIIPAKPTQDITRDESEIDSIYQPNPIIIPEDEVSVEAARILSGEFGRLPDEI